MPFPSPAVCSVIIYIVSFESPAVYFARGVGCPSFSFVYLILQLGIIENFSQNQIKPNGRFRLVFGIKLDFLRAEILALIEPIRRILELELIADIGTAVPPVKNKCLILPCLSVLGYLSRFIICGNKIF